MVRTLLKCILSLKSSGKPHWLILDEINRANIDLAFARGFTLLDLSHRLNSDLVDAEEVSLFPTGDVEKLGSALGRPGLPFPLSFRILGTMNSYDRALLFKLGYALSRRFALVPWSSVVFGAPIGEFRFNEGVRHGPSKTEDLLTQALKELKLAQPLFGDYATIDPKMSERAGEAFDTIQSSVPQLGDASMFDVAMGYLGYMNDRLSEIQFETVRIESATFVDVIRFIMASEMCGLHDHPVRVLDEAVAAYAIPQIDVLARHVRAEALGLGASKGSSLADVFDHLADATRAAGLTSRSLPMLERLALGQSSS